MYSFLFFLLFFPLLLCGVDEKPWFSKSFQPQVNLDYFYINSRSVSTELGQVAFLRNDQCLDLTLSGSFDRWNGQVSVGTIRKKTQKDHFRTSLFSLQYKKMNGLVGDPLSLVLGLNYQQSPKTTVADITSLLHGTSQLEGYVSLGKEQVDRQFWTSRVWGVIACGRAYKGPCWLRSEIAYDKNYRDAIQIGLFAKAILGLGSDPLLFDQYFKGVASIQHRSLDFGCHYAFLSDLGIFKGGYSYRAYSKNCVKNVHEGRISWLYPFGI